MYVAGNGEVWRSFNKRQRRVEWHGHHGGLERAQPEGRGPIRFMAGVQEDMAKGYGMGNGAEQANVR